MASELFDARGRRLYWTPGVALAAEGVDLEGRALVFDIEPGMG